MPAGIVITPALKPPIVGNKSIDALIVAPKSVTACAGRANGFCPKAVPPKPRPAKKKVRAAALNSTSESAYAW
jgi:hypothetical protein